MRKTKTVKRMELRKWYRKFKLLSMGLGMNVMVYFGFIAFHLIYSGIRAVEVGNTANIEAGNWYTAIRALFKYEEVREHVVSIAGVTVVAVCTVLFLDIAIYRKIAKLRNGKVVLTNEDGTELTLQEVCSLEVWEQVVTGTIPDSAELDADIRQAIVRLVIHWLNKPKLRIIHCMVPAFYFTFFLFGVFDISFVGKRKSSMENKDEG